MSRIVGIMLVRDEDIFVELAIRNTVAFCDELLIADHHSSDATPSILRRLAAEFPDKITVRLIDHPRESHEWIRTYADSPTWIFGVDGDEIYDPAALPLFRQRLLSGEFDREWCVFGNVLNVRKMDGATVHGHLAPPCRSMTKLYNFAAIVDWSGAGCVERLHGGAISFRPGYSASLRRDLHQELSWEESPFRCLHLCFLPRSSQEKTGAPRKNIMDRSAWSLAKVFAKLRGLITGCPAPDWKDQRYGRGPLVEKASAPFFPAS